MEFKIPDTPEELLRQTTENFPLFHKWFPGLLISLVFGLVTFSGFYSIDFDEVGVVCRFGSYHRTTGPGLHWQLPFNMERLDKVKVKRILKEEFGFRSDTLRGNVKPSPKSYHEESLMLTGDLNLLDVTWIVQYHISDPVKFLFNLRTPRETLRDVAESVMRQVIGDSSVNEALTIRRIDINLTVQQRLQAILNSYDCGIQVETVKLQDVNPPDQVKPSFNEVNEAKQEKEQVINESWEAYNKAIPKAIGEAKKTLFEAEGFAAERVNEARGNAANFLSQWEAYKSAKDVTRRRMYLETLNAVLPQAGRVYVIEPKSGHSLPLLKLKGFGADEP